MIVRNNISAEKKARSVEQENPTEQSAEPDVPELRRRVALLSAATIAEMREIAPVLFPTDIQPKAVELAMIIRNEFAKRLAAELAETPEDEDPEFVRIRMYQTLATVRDEIVFMADSGSDWLQNQLAHTLRDQKNAAVVYFWADRYLRSMLAYVGV